MQINPGYLNAYNPSARYIYPAKSGNADQTEPPDNSNSNRPDLSSAQKPDDSANPQTSPSNNQSEAVNEKSAQESRLSQAEKQLLQELKARDLEVRAHEMAHLAAGGPYVTSGATYHYQRGPDGQNYAVGGEVGIDVSAEPNDPEATVQKMQTIRRAALAPADPSNQDRRVAARASQTETRAHAELVQMETEENAEEENGVEESGTENEASETSEVNAGEDNNALDANSAPDTAISTGNEKTSGNIKLPVIGGKRSESPSLQIFSQAVQSYEQNRISANYSNPISIVA